MCLTADPTRICIVNPFQQGGGAEYQISLLIATLKRSQRFDIYHLTRHVDLGIKPDGHYVVPIGNSARAPALGYVSDLIPLYRALSKIQPQVIYQRVAGGYTGICALYARRQHVPFVWHVAHDTDVMPQTLDRGRNLVRRWLEKWSVEYGIRHADRIVTQTQHQSDLLERYYGRRADEVIANFHPEPVEAVVKSQPRTVVWIANLKPWKRPEAFVRLAQAVRDVSDVRFLMVGETPAGAESRSWYVEFMRSVENTPNLAYLGPRSHDEVNELLVQAAVFVNTSEYEGFPNTFIQAWLRDAAVVSLDVNPDSVLDRQRVGIHARTEQGLADAVRSLLTRPDEMAGYVERARTYARTQHSLRNADRLVHLIDMCAARPEPQLC